MRGRAMRSAGCATNAAEWARVARPLIRPCRGTFSRRGRREEASRFRSEREGAHNQGSGLVAASAHRGATTPLSSWRS